MSPNPDPVRDQLTEARRNQILAAAAQIFAEKGFHRATTREIAAAAGISEGTIYNYFASKDDLLLGIMTRLIQIETLGTEFAVALQSDPHDFLVAMLRERLGSVEQNQESLRAILPEVVIDPTLRERFYEQFALRAMNAVEQYVQARIERGELRPVNVPLTARAVQGMFVGLLVLRLLGDEILQAGWEEMPEVIATLLFDGLSPLKGARSE